jgi:hypothetical protein
MRSGQRKGTVIDVLIGRRATDRRTGSAMVMTCSATRGQAVASKPPLPHVETATTTLPVDSRSGALTHTSGGRSPASQVAPPEPARTSCRAAGPASPEFLGPGAGGCRMAPVPCRHGHTSSRHPANPESWGCAWWSVRRCCLCCHPDTGTHVPSAIGCSARWSPRSGVSGPPCAGLGSSLLKREADADGSRR